MEALCWTLVWALFNEQPRWRGRWGGGHFNRVNTRQPLPCPRGCSPAAFSEAPLGGCTAALSVPGPLCGFSFLILGSPVPGRGDSSLVCQ